MPDLEVDGTVYSVQWRNTGEDHTYEVLSSLRPSEAEDEESWLSGPRSLGFVHGAPAPSQTGLMWRYGRSQRGPWSPRRWDSSVGATEGLLLSLRQLEDAERDSLRTGSYITEDEQHEWDRAGAEYAARLAEQLRTRYGDAGENENVEDSNQPQPQTPVGEDIGEGAGLVALGRARADFDGVQWVSDEDSDEVPGMLWIALEWDGHYEIRLDDADREIVGYVRSMPQDGRLTWRHAPTPRGPWSAIHFTHSSAVVNDLLSQRGMQQVRDPGPEPSVRARFLRTASVDPDFIGSQYRVYLGGRRGAVAEVRGHFRPGTTTVAWWQYQNDGDAVWRGCRGEYRRRTDAASAATGLFVAPTRRQRRPGDRAFGVELEITGPEAERVVHALMDAGVAMARGNVQHGGAIPYRHTNTGEDVWTLKTDGSVGGHGLELVSPKLRGAQGFRQLELVCQTLNGIGATVNRSCGLHVHHDFRLLELESCLRQVAFVVRRQSVLEMLVAPSRRGNTYCTRWMDYHLDELLQSTSLAAFGSCGPRGFVNLWAYGIHGSVELRSHAGTTNYQKIAAWIRLGQAMFAAGEAEAQVDDSDPVAMLNDLAPYGVTTEDAAWLLRFQTAGETRRAVRRRIEELRGQQEAAESVLEEVS